MKIKKDSHSLWSHFFQFLTAFAPHALHAVPVPFVIGALPIGGRQLQQNGWRRRMMVVLKHDCALWVFIRLSVSYSLSLSLFLYNTSTSARQILHAMEYSY